MNIFAYIVSLLAMQYCAFMGVELLWPLLTGSDEKTTFMTIVATAIYTILTIALFLSLRWAKVSGHYLRTRPWGQVMWCVLAASGTIIPSIWFQEQITFLPDISSDSLAEVLKSPWGYFAVGILVPLTEEIVFRGAILRSLLKLNKKVMKPWVAIVASALIFAIAHVNPAQMPHAFLIGLLLGWMYRRTGSIVLCVAMHWVNNTAAYVLYNILPNPDAPLIYHFNGNEQTVFLSILFSLCLLIQKLIPQHHIMHPA